jgi:hypothetical protein
MDSTLQNIIDHLRQLKNLDMYIDIDSLIKEYAYNQECYVYLISIKSRVFEYNQLMNNKYYDYTNVVFDFEKQ